MSSDNGPRETGPCGSGLTRGRAMLAAGVCTAAALGAGTRTWATGTATDVLATGLREVSGSTASPAMMGLLLVVMLAVVGLLLGGRALRVGASVLALLAALGATALAVRVALDPAAAVSQAVATELGRTSAQVTGAATTAWAWAGVALLGALTLTVGGIVAGTRRWAGLSSRYDREPATRAASAPAGSRADTAQDGARTTARPTETGSPRTGPDETGSDGTGSDGTASATDTVENAARPRTPTDHAARGPRGQLRTDWDELTEGRDPTLRDP